MAVELRRRRFTIAEYQDMGRFGLIHEDDRVELIDGEIIELTPIGLPHMRAVTVANGVLVRAVGRRCFVSVQNPIRMGDRSEPQPDLVVLRPSFARVDRIPDGEHVILVVEISDSSLAYDRQVKVPIYAGGGVPQTLLVDLQGDLITGYQEPSPEGYRVTRTYRRGERIALVALPKVSLAVADLLG